MQFCLALLHAHHRRRRAEAGALRILETLYEGMLSECYITVAKFGSMPEAVTAFDTTNNRGKDLTMADLLRYWMLKKRTTAW